MPVTVANAALLALESCLYFAFMALLLRLRAHVGIGVLTAALGTLHFLETYLASVFYVATPAGVMTPGSVVLFSGKLVVLLMIYIKEDAATVRQPIYGILAGNLLTLCLAFVLRLHEVFLFSPDARPQTAFIETVGMLMVWGTFLLFIDAIALILLYEKLGKRLRRINALRILVALAAVLAFDQAGFYLALRWLAGVPIEAFYAGLAGKMTAALIFALLAALYLAYAERPTLNVPQALSDVFQTLTYRERFEALADHMARDRTTMLPNMRAFGEAMRKAFADGSAPARRTLMLVELDAAVFDDVERRLGRDNSDALLRTLARCLEEVRNDSDQPFRLGSRQFAMICDCAPLSARSQVEKLRQALQLRADGYGTEIVIQIGLSDAEDGLTADEVYARAQGMLEEARGEGGEAIRLAIASTATPVRIGAVRAALAP